MISDVLVTPLKIIDTVGGNVMHAMKDNDIGYAGFGEAYFSIIGFNAIKAWKRHKEMTLNIVVPHGEIKFVLFDDRVKENCIFQEVLLSKNNYSRLTVPPMIWLGFQGIFPDNSILLNIADINHNPEEVDKKNIKEVNYNWEVF